MHADAIPDADRATLAKPNDVAARILELVRRADEIQNGQRVTMTSTDEVLR